MSSEDRSATTAGSTIDPQASPTNGSKEVEGAPPAVDPSHTTRRSGDRRIGDRRVSRPLPASVLSPPAPPPAPHMEDYTAIVGQAQIDTLRFLAKELKGKTIKMVN